MSHVISAPRPRFNSSPERNPWYALSFHQALKGQHNRWIAHLGLGNSTQSLQNWSRPSKLN